MHKTAPKIDRRTPGEIYDQAKDLLGGVVPGLKLAGASHAVLKIFARYCELIITRINKTPEKNLLAFLNLLDVPLLAPQPARVPLTFEMVPGGLSSYTVVPAGTQVSGSASEEESEPVVFETEQELYVTAGTLSSIFVRDPRHDRFGDYSFLAKSVATEGVALFQGDQPTEHMFKIGHKEFLNNPFLKELRLTFQFSENQGEIEDKRILRWEIWDGEKVIPIVPGEDDTNNLTKDGDVVFRNLPQEPQPAPAGATSRRLRCRLLTPLTRATRKEPGALRCTQVPRVRTVMATIQSERTSLLIEAAFLNNVPMDLSKEFFILGEKPKFGDVLYLAQSAALMSQGAQITLHLDLVNPNWGGEEPPIPRTEPSANLQLRWEVWGTEEWSFLGTSEASREMHNEETGFVDTTRAFTRSGSVTFILPVDPSVREINGQQNRWIRVRIISGDYGTDASYVLKEPDSPDKGVVFKPPTLAPPVARILRMDVLYNSRPEQPDRIVTYNDFTYLDVTGSIGPTGPGFIPFYPTPDLAPSLYLGFTLPKGQGFPDAPLTLYFLINSTQAKAAVASRKITPRIKWGYWNGQAWLQPNVTDNTDALTRSGLVHILVPNKREDFPRRNDFRRSERWVRVRLETVEYPFEGRLNGVFLNTTMASQAVTIREEILGSSKGSEHETFKTLRAPVLAGQQLEVEEPAETPSYEPYAQEKRTWIAWQEVKHLCDSDPRARNYELDHFTGVIRFGDGKNGREPARGVDVRMKLYRTGGGALGNLPAGAIEQLKTTIPYIKTVCNFQAAAGGADAEPLESFLERAPRSLRHGDRAVTKEDYEDLARLASPEVARAACIPLYHPGDKGVTKTRRPGVLSLIIVPHSSEENPMPSAELLSLVQTYIEARTDPGVGVCTIGPAYLPIDVDVEVALKTFEGMSDIRQQVLMELKKFLHPLTGGVDSTGWEFGRQPHSSVLSARIKAIPGIDHIMNLTINKQKDLAGLGDTRQFLICSGNHTVNFTFMFAETAG